MAILFAVCVYFFNALVFPQSANRYIFAVLLALNAVVMVLSAFHFLRCLTLSVNWKKSSEKPKSQLHVLSALPEGEIEIILLYIVKSFRIGTYCLFPSFFITLLLVCLLAFVSLPPSF